MNHSVARRYRLYLREFAMFPRSAHSLDALLLAMLIGFAGTGYCLDRSPATVRAGAAAPAATWIATGNLHAARIYHTATLLQNGKVLVAGGAAVGVAALASAELYDPVTGTWSMTGALNAARSSHTATLLQNGKVLVAGGAGASSAENAELYDPATGAWSLTGSLATNHVAATATLLRDGKVLVVGGTENFDPTNDAELYDPVKGTWSTAGRPAYAREGHSATLLADGSVLVAGGIVGAFDFDIEFPAPSTAELYDPVSNTWSLVGNPSIESDNPAVLLSNGSVLKAGGFSVIVASNGESARNEKIASLYDPAARAWRATGSLLSGRGGHTLTVLLDGHVLAAGGVGAGQPSELYDVDSGTWGAAAEMNTARYSHTATLLPNGTVLIAGGSLPSDDVPMPTDSAELYLISPPSITIGAGFTGAWYDPAQSGHGLFVEILPDNRFYAAWFAFNPAGTQQAWFTGVGTYSGNTATITDIALPTGGRWIPNFNSGHIALNGWGTLNFIFTDCNHGRVDFNSVAGYGSGSMELVRLTQPAGLSCP